LKQKRDEFEWVDPLDKYQTSSKPESAEWTDTDVVEDDLAMIDGSDALLVHWELVPMAGTPMEIRYAYENAMPIVVQSTVPEKDCSIWLEYHVDDISDTFSEAIDTLQRILQNNG